MKKKNGTKSKPRTKKPPVRQEAAPRRSRVVKPNGGLHESVPAAPEVDEKVPIGEAMRQAVEALGERTIPADAQLLQSQMGQLADILDDITRREAAYNAKADEAKTAKKSLESAQELLTATLRGFTHAAPLPLFDRKTAEDDRQAMLDGGDVPAADEIDF